jgi:hypothetical protein
VKVLIIDNLFQPNLKNKLANGAQKFTRNQKNLLSKEYDTYYITAAGSDLQYKNQFILENFFDISLPRNEKIDQTKRTSQEIIKIINQVQPDIVLDSSCKHLVTCWNHYPVGIVFEHYHKSSMILDKTVTDKFNKKSIFWCGVSKHQAKAFNNYFHDTICIHYIDELPDEIKPAKPYGVFVGRWDAGKYPHVALKNYLKSGCNYPIECFIKYGGTEIANDQFNKLVNSGLMNFHIDAPRETILNGISEASFGLGMGNESTGIVSLEYATRGIPYIVPGNKSVAEAEHLPPEALFLCDRSIEESMPSQIKKHVDYCISLPYDYRVHLSKTVINTYNASRFIDDHKRIIKQASEKFNNGSLECFMI